MKKFLLTWLLGLTYGLALGQVDVPNTLDASPTANGESGVTIGLGFLPGYARVTALGHVPSAGASVGAIAVDVWEGGGAYPFPATAQTLEVLSSSANDTAAGTGARTVSVSCLDAGYNQEALQTVSLNGITPVALTNQCLRVNVFTTATSGSGHVNAGDLTLRVAGGGTTLAIARAGYGFSRSAVYTVPAPNSTNTSLANFGFFQQSSNLNQRLALEVQINSNQPYRHEARYGIVLSQKTDFTLRITNQAQANTNATAAFEGVLVTNGQIRK